MPNELTVAIVQTAPIPLAVADGIEKAVRDARAAIAEGARLIAFGETVLGGYPIWLDSAPGASLWDHPGTRAMHRLMLENAVTQGDERLAVVQDLCDETGACLSIGAHLRDRSSLYNVQFVFGPNRPVLARRKLVPTHGERLMWMRGDGSTLGVQQADWGRISTLICWEHWMPLARAAVHNEGPSAHISAWPTVRDNYLIASQHLAFEGACFVLAAGTVQRKDDLLDGLSRVGGNAEAEALIREIPADALQHGGSAIIGPDTGVIGPRGGDGEETLVQTIDLDRRSEALTALDTDGHYSRPDVFELHIDTRPKTGVIRS
ncbi:MAG: nitrilase-related carbon-nitrogen hydrolase [Pacificimonas sp.]